MFFSFKTGLFLGLSLIIAIGSQNLFIIRQGLKKESPYLCASICFLSDCILIFLSVMGISSLLVQIPLLKTGLLIIGIVFLTIYGLRGIRKGLWHSKRNLGTVTIIEQTYTSADKLIVLALSFSFLNPQAILDTMVIIGGSANQYHDADKYAFMVGTIVASLLWFYGLAFSTHKLGEKILSEKFWYRIELASGVLMIIFAGQFLYQLYVIP
jgi:L-lysine exporter family protein LysE/ArgO